MTFVSVLAFFLVLLLFACTRRCVRQKIQRTSLDLDLSLSLCARRGRRARCGPWWPPGRPRLGFSTWGGWGDPFPPFSTVSTERGRCVPHWGGPRSAGRPPPQRLLLFELFLAAAAAVLTLSVVQDKEVLTEDY